MPGRRPPPPNRTLPVRKTEAVLAILDISGCTNFIVKRVVALEHAEQIITDLIGTLIDDAERPFVVNKLEGDAMLLFAETDGATAATVAATWRLVDRAFGQFERSLERIRDQRSHCNCDACANVGNLRLKAFLHVGEITVKQVRQFEEIAGEPVILLHRLMKNSLASREYVLFTDSYHAALAPPPAAAVPHSEVAEGFGPVALHVFDRSNPSS